MPGGTKNPLEVGIMNLKGVSLGLDFSPPTFSYHTGAGIDHVMSI